MERLTSYESDCKREMICRYEDCDTCEENCPHLNEDNCPCLQEILNKLAEYQDLEEKGKLMKLPCAVGDKIYIIYSGKNSFSIEEAAVEEVSTQRIWIDSNYFDYDDFGKTIFLTKSAAEHALKEVKGNVENIF